MFSTRAMQRSSTIAAKGMKFTPSTASSSILALSPALRSTGLKAISASQIRLGSTATPTGAPDHNTILAAQRLRRPLAPHLTIYQPQLTSVMSIMNRITGGAISAGMYAFLLAYLASPYLGWHLESATLAAAFGAWPVAAKIAAKTLVAAPFTYHSWNGLRHFAWDTGRQLHLKGVYRTGYIVLGLTALSTAGLVMI